MDAAREHIQRLQKQLAGLDASQKMLMASLATILVLTVVWFTSYAAKAEFAPVLDQSLTPAEISPMRAALQGAGIEFRIENDRMLVPADRQIEALSVLGFNSAIPRNSGEAFDKMIAKMSTWDPAFKSREMFLQAKQRTLSQILGRAHGVRDADVMLDLHQQRRIGKRLLPSASITLWTHEGAKTAPQQLIDGAVATVCGAVADLEPENVKITVNGFAARVRSDNAHYGAADELSERIASAEAYYADKIYDFYRYIPKIMVSVTVDVDATSRRTESYSVDGDNTIIQPLMESSELAEMTGGGSTVEPGAVSNSNVAGGDLWDQAFGGGESETVESTEARNQVDYGRRKTEEMTPAGTPTVVAAAARVPLSFIRQEYKSRFPDESEPTRTDMKAVEGEILREVTEGVARLANMEDERYVSVEIYTDDVPMLVAASEDIAGFNVGGGALGALVTDYGKEAMLGLLAVVALFAVLRVVKQSSPEAITDIPDLNEALASLRGEMAVGEAADASLLLNGQEADPEQIEARQMVEQVQELVAENPDAAAQLMRRWLNN